LPRLGKAGKKRFHRLVGAGDPNLEATRRLALAFDEAGVDVLEHGVPFSDPRPMAWSNQLAAQRGLESGTTAARSVGNGGATAANHNCPSSFTSISTSPLPRP